MKINKATIALIMLMLFSVSGCSNITDYSKYQSPKDVNCSALYVTTTFPQTSYRVKITQFRVDRFGDTWVRVRSNMDIQFYNGWQKKGQFVNYQCSEAANELRN